MNLEIKTKWLEALRSGKYKRGERYLRRRTTEKGEVFCCLGVLCDIMQPEGWRDHSPDAQDVVVGFAGQEVVIGFAGGSEVVGVFQGYPPAALLDQAGLDVDTSRELARLNDHGRTFAEIADIIERDL
jgi:hypothetical protein